MLGRKSGVPRTSLFLTVCGIDVTIGFVERARVGMKRGSAVIVAWALLLVSGLAQAGPGRELPFHWEHRGLAPGKHTIKLTLLPDKAPASHDRFLNVAGFEALPAG